jgi:hypothetical protein
MMMGGLGPDDLGAPRREVDFGGKLSDKGFHPGGARKKGGKSGKGGKGALKLGIPKPRGAAGAGAAGAGAGARVAELSSSDDGGVD